MTPGEGNELLKITENVTDLINKLFGPVAEKFGMILGDRAEVYRVKNLISTVQKTQALLRDAGLPVNAVRPRVLLPIIENCSIEDDETLQKLWAGLLATESQQSDTVSPSFIETLKQLTPDEAKYMEKLFRDRERLPNAAYLGDRWIAPYALNVQSGAPSSARDNFERLGLVQRDYAVKLKTATSRLRNARDVDAALDAIEATEAEIGYNFLWTEYAIKFLAACHGPHKSSAQRPGGGFQPQNVTDGPN